MIFSDFAQYLNKLENTSKRLEITSILAEMIKELDENEVDKGIYLALGYLKAPFESLKFNIADKMVFRIIENTYMKPGEKGFQQKLNDHYQESGDLGNVVYKLGNPKNESSATITEVYNQLIEIAKTEGLGSQEIKVSKTTSLIKTMDNLSAKYCIRIILGTTRLGFTELTVISALSNYLNGTKDLAEEIEKKYNTHPDIGLLAKMIKQKGIKGIESLHIETGVPVLSQKAQRLAGGIENVMTKIDNVWAEFKFDGTRVQLHFDKSKTIKENDGQKTLLETSKNLFLIRTFTRNLEETTHQYPDIAAAARKQIKAESVILDGEAIGYNKTTGEFLAFQETIQRKRKHNIEETVKNVPIKYFVFDILYLNGRSMIGMPLIDRRKTLEKIIKAGDVISIAEHKEANDLEKLREYYDEAVTKNLEGLIAKNPKDPYQAGARSFSWIKIKRADQTLLEDSIECTILGYYYGKGGRSKFGIGGFLAGVYDPDTDSFKTLTKVGTGLKDEDFIALKKLADNVRVAKPPANVIMDKIFAPDVYVRPSIVVEIGADEISVSPTHSTGYALRFPRLLKFRKDKSPAETTTLKEIESMFEAQKIKKAG